MAGGAAERAAALGIASAPGPASPLRTDPAWLFRVAVSKAPVEDMAVVAPLLRDGPRRGERRVDDRWVGKTAATATRWLPLGRDSARSRWRGRLSRGQPGRFPRAGRSCGNSGIRPRRRARRSFHPGSPRFESDRCDRASSDPSPGPPPCGNTTAAPCGIDRARHG